MKLKVPQDLHGNKMICSSLRGDDKGLFSFIQLIQQKYTVRLISYYQPIAHLIEVIHVNYIYALEKYI